MNKPDFYRSDDYAGLTTRIASFYYGYEHSICCECGKENNGEYCEEHEDADREWCFVAKMLDKEIVIPYSKLGANDMFSVVECLNMGIGWVLAKYNLIEE